jgi:preprotein translocase subunit YajC
VISSAFAQAAVPAAAGIETSLMSFLPLLLMVGVLYFIAIRPQMKRQKEHRSMVQALQKGDEVVTTGGLLGRVESISDAYFQLEVSQLAEKPVCITVQRSAVQLILPKGSIKELA